MRVLFDSLAGLLFHSLAGLHRNYLLDNMYHAPSLDRLTQFTRLKKKQQWRLSQFKRLCVDSHNVGPYCVDPPSQCFLGLIAVI